MDDDGDLTRYELLQAQVQHLESMVDQLQRRFVRLEREADEQRRAVGSLQGHFLRQAGGRPRKIADVDAVDLRALFLRACEEHGGPKRARDALAAAYGCSTRTVDRALARCDRTFAQYAPSTPRIGPPIIAASIPPHRSATT